MSGNWHNARKNTRARPRMIGLEAIYRFPAGIAITVREEKAGRKEALLDGHFFRIFPRNLNDWRRVETVKGRSDDKTSYYRKYAAPQEDRDRFRRADYRDRGKLPTVLW